MIGLIGIILFFAALVAGSFSGSLPIFLASLVLAFAIFTFWPGDQS